MPIASHSDSCANISLLLIWTAATFLFACLAVSSTANGAENVLLKKAIGHFANQEDQAAESTLLRLSESENSDADVVLGLLYSDPFSPLVDFDLALDHLRRSAEAGNAEGIFQLAESYFWSTYRLNSTTAEVSHKGVELEESLTLLKRAAPNHQGARMRLALQCLVYDWPCDEGDVQESYAVPATSLGEPRMVTDIVGALNNLNSDDLDGFRSYLQVGLSSADPLTADFIASEVWSHVRTKDQCPSAESKHVLLRLFSEKNSTMTPFSERGGLGVRDCFGEETIERLEKMLGDWLQSIVTRRSYISWCFKNEPEQVGQCITTSLWDHVFSCSRVTMSIFFLRHAVDGYPRTKRYQSCRRNLMD